MVMRFLTASAAKVILNAIRAGMSEVEVSLDLGRTSSTIRVDVYERDIDKLKKIVADPSSVYFIRDGEYYKAAISRDHFYKLMPTGENTAPALVIDGVLMHRVKETNPMDDASSKAVHCAKGGFNMLEVCTGLGYSTIACLSRGVASIITIEKDHDVLDLARINPWSKEIFDNPHVTVIEGDAIDVIREFDNRQFDSILHDPPRFTMATELYTKEFYRDLFRVLKSNGVMFHYVGSPGARHRRIDLQKGIMSRLRKVGFLQIRRRKNVFGITAKKP